MVLPPLQGSFRQLLELPSISGVGILSFQRSLWIVHCLGGGSSLPRKALSPGVLRGDRVASLQTQWIWNLLKIQWKRDESEIARTVYQQLKFRKEGPKPFWKPNHIQWPYLLGPQYIDTLITSLHVIITFKIISKKTSKMNHFELRTQIRLQRKIIIYFNIPSD